MFAAILTLAVAGLPQSTVRLPQSTLVFNPAGSPGPAVAEQWVADPIYGYVGRHVGGRLVGGWFPRWNAYVDYDEAGKRWGKSHDGPMPPGTVKQSLTVVPPGHHAHVTTDGRTIVHGDWNYGNPAAHAGVAYPWPKVAFPGQAVPTFCPPGRQ